MTSELSLKQRAATWVINRVLALANKNVDIAGLQAKHNAPGGRVVRMKLTDVNKSWDFRVQDGRFEFVKDPKDIAGGFDTTCDVVIALATGKRRMMDPASGTFFDAEYTPLHALTQGDLRLWGEAATNDALLFARHVYRDVYGKLRNELATSQGAVKA